jgi:hypothetical protein
MFKSDNTKGMPEFDTESIGSGGSVLIGVEDEDDFRNYKQSPADDNFQFGPGQPSGNSNPMFGAEGDDGDDFEFLENQSKNGDSSENDFHTQEPPMPNVTRRNPLLHMSSVDA